MEGNSNLRRHLAALSAAKRRQTAASRPAGEGDRQVDKPDPEVSEKPTRRRYSAEYKLKVLQQAEKCTKRGELGALLRREGIYSSHLNTWQKQREEGTLHGLAPKKRGRKSIPKNPLADELQQLRRENEKLKHKLQQAETIIDVQKKLCGILGMPQSMHDVTEIEE